MNVNWFRYSATNGINVGANYFGLVSGYIAGGTTTLYDVQNSTITINAGGRSFVGMLVGQIYGTYTFTYISLNGYLNTNVNDNTGTYIGSDNANSRSFGGTQ